MDQFELLAWRPWLRVLRGFVTDEERRDLLALTGALPTADASEDHAGLAIELPVSEAPALARLTERVEAACGLQGMRSGFVRLRSYEVGQGHPPHTDHYEIESAQLVATAMLTLEAPEAGGRTEFPEALPWPTSVAPLPGQLAVWHNLLRDGTEDPRSAHRGASVLAGSKRVLLWFFYLSLDEWKTWPPFEGEGARPAIPPPPPGTLLTCIDDGVPTESLALLQEACEQRGVLLRRVAASRFRYAPEDRPPPFSMLFRPATSPAALHVEDFLIRDDLASFFPGVSAVHFACTSPLRAMERAGVNVPRTFPVGSADPGLLASFVERLGGFPVVIKAGGGEGGVGVMRADSMPALRSLLDYLVHGGGVPMLSAYVPGAMHHRVVVVGDRAVATYENPIRPDDFRSLPSGDPAHYSADVPPELAGPAIRAVQAQRVLFGGVDLLRHPSGRVYVLEVNFPCYFPQATAVGGVDVAGEMVRFLIDRATQLAALDQAGKEGG
jgi:hypothetical protein